MTGQGAVRLSWAGQAATLAEAVAGLHTDTGVLAAASPFLAALVSDTGEESPLCLVGLTYQQALLAVEFCYTGRLEGLTESEVSRLLEATAHLGIIGLSWSPATVLVKQETPTAELEDDVFAEVEVEEEQFRLGVGTGLEEEEEEQFRLGVGTGLE